MNRRLFVIGLWIVLVIPVETPLVLGTPGEGPRSSQPRQPVLREGFDGGLSGPWGADRYAAAHTTWWNSGDCRSTVAVDIGTKRSGAASLHVVNTSPRAAHVFGTTQRPLRVEPGRRYRVTLWAKAGNLASNGAVSVVVDGAWVDRPIQLPKGTYDWTRFSGEFVAKGETIPLRLLSEDRGEVWIDDLGITAAMPDGPPRLSAEARKRVLSRVGAGVARFREAAIRDYEAALAEHASDAVRRRFQAFDAVLWPAGEPRVGWSFFLSMSVIGVADQPTGQPIVAFYQPWADVFLITVWETKGETAEIVDAEVLMGDWVRNPEAVTPDVKAVWLRGNTYRPVAAATAVVDSIRIFRSKFAGAAADDWRTRLPGLDEEPSVVEFNLFGAALLMTHAMTRVHDFWNAEVDEPAQLAVLRSRTLAVLKAAGAGKMKELLDGADETLPAVRARLLKTDPEVFRRLTVAATVLGKDESMVFLTPIDGAGGFLSVLVGGDGGSSRVRRVDFLSYAAVQEHLSAPGTRHDQGKTPP